ncbi:hypothetical protein MLD38_035770 [Melastoma candidum]|uniref:Uncharacterized protein n=1 Tax=Melastoma candidum TaxID=119954 RepID=A0ACB9LJF8_9MYRT|nr:hypothetical protein MLD38_035770 [Melastoma candidum]
MDRTVISNIVYFALPIPILLPFLFSFPLPSSSKVEHPRKPDKQDEKYSTSELVSEIPHDSSESIKLDKHDQQEAVETFSSSPKRENPQQEKSSPKKKDIANAN